MPAEQPQPIDYTFFTVNRTSIVWHQDSGQESVILSSTGQSSELGVHKCEDPSCVIGHAGLSHPSHASLGDDRDRDAAAHIIDLHTEEVHHSEKPEFAESMNRNERPWGAAVYSESAAEFELTDGVSVAVAKERLGSGDEFTAGLAIKVGDVTIGAGAKVYAEGEEHSEDIQPALNIQAKFSL